MVILIELFQLVIYMFYLDVFLSIRSCLSGDFIKSEYTSIPFLRMVLIYTLNYIDIQYQFILFHQTYYILILNILAYHMPSW